MIKCANEGLGQNDLMKKVIQISLALIAWFAVITQYFLMIENKVAPVAETTVRFFSFFTILTNFIVAIYFTFAPMNFKDRFSKFLSKPATLTAITVYILVVGLVYQVILRQIWEPKGLQMVVDELLHTVIPSAVLLYWVFSKGKSEVTYKALPAWLIYPLVYLVFVLIRGYISAFYPYPFTDVNVLGYYKVFINSVGLLFAFLALSVLFIAISKASSRNLR